MKRLLVSLLCVAMLVTFMPSLAWAGNGTSTVLPDADSNGVITLQQDVSLTDNWIIDDEYTLDLNGYTLDMASYTIAVEGKLVIKDATAGQPVVDGNMDVSYGNSGKITGSKSTVQAQNGGTVILESGTLRSTGDIALKAVGNTSADVNREPIYSTVTVEGGYVYSREYGVGVFGYGAVVNVHDGVVEAEDNAAIAGNGTMNSSSNMGGTEINISGGTLISNIITSGYIACGIYHPQQGSLNIEGGKIYAKKGVGVLMRSGSANITGGEIVATGAVSGKVGDSTIIENCYGVVYDTKSNYPGLGDKDTIVIDEDAVISA